MRVSRPNSVMNHGKPGGREDVPLAQQLARDAERRQIDDRLPEHVASRALSDSKRGIRSSQSASGPAADSCRSPKAPCVGSKRRVVHAYADLDQHARSE